MSWNFSRYHCYFRSHAWWPMILAMLKNRNCTPKLFKILCSDYLSDRTINFSFGDFSIEREVEMGCPQGSVLRPEFWNVEWRFLRAALAWRVYLGRLCWWLIVFSFGNSRTEIGRKSEEGLSAILERGKRNSYVRSSQDYGTPDEGIFQ